MPPSHSINLLNPINPFHSLPLHLQPSAFIGVHRRFQIVAKIRASIASLFTVVYTLIFSGGFPRFPRFQ